MVTLKDIAAEAGVSITTVSNVVHNRKSRVSEKKVAKIWEIIEREHYVPSMSARSLANDQSAIIAMVTYITPRTTGSTVSDPFMSSVAASVEQRTGDAVTQRASLTGDAAAVKTGNHVDVALATT